MQLLFKRHAVNGDTVDGIWKCVDVLARSSMLICVPLRASQPIEPLFCPLYGCEISDIQNARAGYKHSIQLQGTSHRVAGLLGLTRMSEYEMVSSATF